MTPKYKEYLKSKKWLDKKKKVLKRDNYKCTKCQSGNRQLEVHHLTYDNIYNESSSDLVTLCDRCHKMEHNIQEPKIIDTLVTIGIILLVCYLGLIIK